MSLVGRSVLHELCHRAVVCDSFAPSSAAARRLGSLCASIVSLSSSSHAADAPLLRCANECVRRLAALLPRVPPADAVGDDAAAHVLRVARRGRGGVSPALLADLLAALDERLSPARIAQWPAPRLLASLHAVAAAAPQVPLDMTESMLFCAQARLAQFSPRETSRLLWCVAALRATDSHATLWSATCRRITRMCEDIPPASRALVVEALFLSPSPRSASAEEAQRELLVRLQSNPSAAGSSSALRSDEALELQLLAAAHTLSADALTALLVRVLQRPLAERKCAPLLVRELLRRTRWPVHTLRRIAEVAAAMPKCRAGEEMCARLLDAARQKELDPIDALSIACMAVATAQVQVGDHAMHRSREVLVELLRRAHTGRDVVWERYSGRQAAAVAVALDRMAPQNTNNTNTNFSDRNGNDSSSGSGHAESEMMEAACGLVRQFPASCDANVTGTECVAAIVTLCEICRNCDSALCGEARLAATLLQRCTEAITRESKVSPFAVHDMWRAAAPCGTALDPLRRTLLRHVNARPVAFTLRDVARFVDGSAFPLEALALFTQRLSLECGAGRSVAPTHLAALVAALENIAARGDPAEVDRALLLLFARSLGEPEPLVRRVTFTVPLLARLFHCCRSAADVAFATQAVVLELLEESCAKAERMDELNCAAALLPHMEHGELRDRIARCLCERGKQLSSSATPKVQKALLVVYLQKAGAEVKEDLLEALRR